MPLDSDTERKFDRLEKKVDKLIEGFDRLTRVEERNDTLQKTQTRHEEWLKDHEKRISEAEREGILHKAGVNSNSKLLWWLLTAGSSFVVGISMRGIASLFGF